MKWRGPRSNSELTHDKGPFFQLRSHFASPPRWTLWEMLKTNLGVTHTMMCSSNFFISLKIFINFSGKNKVSPTSIPNLVFLAEYYLATGYPATTCHNHFPIIWWQGHWAESTNLQLELRKYERTYRVCNKRQVASANSQIPVSSQMLRFHPFPPTAFPTGEQNCCPGLRTGRRKKCRIEWASYRGMQQWCTKLGGQVT